MFNFFHIIYTKAVLVVVSIAVAVGLMSVPATFKNEQKTTIQKTPTTTQTIVNTDVPKKETPAIEKPVGSSGGIGGGSVEKNSFTPPQNSVLCNGKYWTTTCPAGQKYYCPAIGDAQCLVEMQPPSLQPQPIPVYQDPLIKIERCKIEAQTNINNFLDVGKAAVNEGFKKCVQDRLGILQQQIGGDIPGVVSSMVDLARSSCQRTADDVLNKLQIQADEIYNQQYLVCLNK